MLMVLLRTLTQRFTAAQREAAERAPSTCRAGAGGGGAGLAGRCAQAGWSCGEDHRDGFSLAAQREADGLLGLLFGSQTGAAVHGHQRAHHHKRHKDGAHHQEGHVDGLCERQK